MFTEKINYRDVYDFAMCYWRRRPRVAFALVVFMLAGTVLDVFVPVYTGRIIDVLAKSTASDTAAIDSALHALMVFIVLGVLHQILRSSALACWVWFAIRNLYDIVTEATQKVQRFSSDWHANSFAGGTVRKITRGMWAFDLFGDTLFVGLLPSVTIMVAMTIMLLIKLPLIGLFTALMIVIYSAVSIWMALAILAPGYRAASRADTSVGATLADIITGNPTVKVFGAEQREDAVFNKAVRQWRQVAQRAWITGEFGSLARGFLRMVMLGGMIGGTIWLWQVGRATAGDIALSLTSFFVVSGYMRDIGMHIAHLQKAISDMEDIIGFWKRKDEIRDILGASVLVINEERHKAGEIVFENVRFSYENVKKPLYDDMSIRIAPGEKVALVGQSGSGKSTFVKLAQRLYDIQGGEIRIDGQNIAHVTQESLRQTIALVPQEPILFHRSLAENLAYGRPGASMDEIIAAARQAYAHDFIESLPQGYDTLVGERGVKLSGGERQRVAIARAILSDAPILILDEATSSLDSVSEHVIQKALESLMENRTTITIAHRLSTIRRVDRILVFDKGHITEQGTHTALVEKEGSQYRRLYEMQAFDFLGAA